MLWVTPNGRWYIVLRCTRSKGTTQSVQSFNNSSELDAHKVPISILNGTKPVRTFHVSYIMPVQLSYSTLVSLNAADQSNLDGCYLCESSPRKDFRIKQLRIEPAPVCKVVESKACLRPPQTYHPQTSNLHERKATISTTDIKDLPITNQEIHRHRTLAKKM